MVCYSLSPFIVTIKFTSYFSYRIVNRVRFLKYVFHYSYIDSYFFTQMDKFDIFFIYNLYHDSPPFSCAIRASAASTACTAVTLL